MRPEERKAREDRMEMEKDLQEGRVKKGKKGRVLRIILKTIGILILLVYVAVPVGFGIYSTSRFPHEVGNPPERFEEVSLTTTDGVPLAAWYAPPENGAAIVLIHGATSNREAVRGYADALRKEGFGVLALDLRGHGESGGDGVNSFGWNGTEDVGAAVEYLSRQDGVSRIGALGLSLGGEVLLHAAASYPEIRAVMADGATFLSLEDYLALPSNRSFVRSYTNRVVFATAQVFGGPPPKERIVDSMMEAKDTRFLLVAGGLVKNEVDYNSLFAKLDASRCDLWIAEGAGHTEAFSRDPGAYTQRMIRFFERGLLEGEE
jgi:pimeloyl-ACP methyl ester carboxylesterase